MDIDIRTQLMFFSEGAYFVLSIVFFFMQWAKEKENALQRWLAWLLAQVMVVNVLSFILFFVWKPFEDDTVETDFLQMTVIFPCVLLLNEATHPGSMTWRKVAVGFVPIVLLWLCLRITGNTLFYIIASLLAVGTAVAGIIYTMYSMAKYNRMLRDNYSNMDKKDLHWLSGILIEFTALLVLWVITGIWTTVIDAMVYNFLSCAIWASLYFFVNRQKVIEISAHDERQEEHALEMKYHFAESFVQVVEKEQRYLDPDLSLADLAAELNTNRTYISRYINSDMHCSFYEYINNLRIRYAVKLLEDTDDKIDVVAMRSGFNSITTFRRIFSKTYGMTASEYRRKRGDGQEI